MTALPIGPQPDDPLDPERILQALPEQEQETLQALPEQEQETFLAQYRCAVDGAHDPAG